jgi:hypothetical protein
MIHQRFMHRQIALLLHRVIADETSGEETCFPREHPKPREAKASPPAP